MIVTRIACSDAILHQTRQRRQHAHRWVNAACVKITIQHDLTLCDIARQIGDRVGDIVVRHGEDRNLRDRAALSLDNARALIERRKVRIQIAGETLSAGNLTFGGAKFTQRLSVGGHIREDDKDVHAEIKGQIFRSSQRAARG